MDPLTWIMLGGLVLSGLGLWNDISTGEKQADIAEEQLDLDKVNAYQGALSNLTSMKESQEQLANTITATEGSISEYQQFLDRFPAYEQLQKEQALEQGRTAQMQLMQNFAASEVTAAASGTTGSSSLVAQQAKGEVVRQFGTDLKADAFGGLFGQQYNELVLDLQAEKTQAIGQIDILGTSLDSLKESFGAYDATIAEQGSLVDKLKKEAGL